MTWFTYPFKIICVHFFYHWMSSSWILCSWWILRSETLSYPRTIILLDNNRVGRPILDVTCSIDRFLNSFIFGFSLYTLYFLHLFSFLSSFFDKGIGLPPPRNRFTIGVLLFPWCCVRVGHSLFFLLNPFTLMLFFSCFAFSLLSPPFSLSL